MAFQDSEDINRVEDFIKNVCERFDVTPSDIHEKLTADCVAENFDSPLCQGIKSLFRYDCLCDPSRSLSNHRNYTKLFAHLIAGSKGIDELTRALKNFDYSERCSLVWIGDYFAYRCRTCGLTPSMSLCGSCFNAGNHKNHDFNKFKSTCGGACDCGDPSVIKPSGNCRFHGPDKVANRPLPPIDLIAALKFLLPSVIKALMYWFWDQCRVNEAQLNEFNAPMVFFLHRLHACGWITQQLMVNIMIDPDIFTDLTTECANTPAFCAYRASFALSPQGNIDGSDRGVADQEPKHKTLLESFVFTIVKLRFPESLSTLLIGLLPINEFKILFTDAYVDHYETIASTLAINSNMRDFTPEKTMQLNNRIVHISVQLFSGYEHAFRMVKEKRLHEIIVKWLTIMFSTNRTRLDDRGRMTVNCESMIVQNNCFWPLTSDLCNIISHKAIADIFVEDSNFLTSYTNLLQLMQFMQCFSLKEGSHVEYESMSIYGALTMEAEVSIGVLWSLWDHYKVPTEKEHCLMYARACVKSLAEFLTYLGSLVVTFIQPVHTFRKPLSIHLPLSRHVSCFVSLAVFTHHTELKQIMEPFLSRSPNVLRRLMDELANVLLGCQEVLIGYWVRNGTTFVRYIAHSVHSQLCYSMIDLDICLFQICAALMHPVYIINSLVDQTRLLQGFSFHRELMALTEPPRSDRIIDRQPLAIGAWLHILCWILDLRNNLGLSEKDLTEKELICFLAHSNRKRSDLSSQMPDRGMPQPADLIDECLDRVATYVAPSCDSSVGSVTSGCYSLKSELWDEKFDPVFYTLRMPNRKEYAVMLENYRNHCRLKTGIPYSSSFWPPYRLPSDIPSEIADLENMLHSRHLHYLLFSLLSLFVYGDPLVPEDSLVIIIHIIHRAVVAGALLLEKDGNSDRLVVETEPPMPIIDPFHCTEAVLAATNRYAELEAMQFVDADSDNEVDPETDKIENPMDVFSRLPLVDGPEAMEVDEPTPLRRANAFRLRRPSNIPLKWDLSIVACPYPTSASPPTIFQNLPTWLTVTNSYVVPADLDWITTPVSGSRYRAPVKNENNEMVDSILSLLVKAHARLYLNRMTKVSIDPLGQLSNSAQDSPFVELPSESDEYSRFNCSSTTRSLAVLNSTEGSPDETPLARAIQADTSSSTPDNKMVKLLLNMPHELRYFAVTPPAYSLPEDRLTSSQPSISGDCGDGVFWIEKLLDKIVESSLGCKEELKIYLERANNPFDLPQEAGGRGAGKIVRPDLPSNLQSNTKTRSQRKRAAAERQKQVMAKMASKQKLFTEKFLKTNTLEETKNECDYNCVICHSKPEKPSPMVMVVSVWESGLSLDMRNYSNFSHLSGERMTYSRSYLCEDSCIPRALPILPPELRPQPSEVESSVPNRYAETSVDSAQPQRAALTGHICASLLIANPIPQTRRHVSSSIIIPPGVVTATELPRGDVLNPVAYVEKRQWWHLALPVELVSYLAVLRNGVSLQTCGHIVHRDCLREFQTRANRGMPTCPLCRREIHLLLPIHPNSNPQHSQPVGEKTSFGSTLLKRVAELKDEKHSIWDDLVDNKVAQRIRYIASFISGVSEAAVVLRTQFECELSTLMVYPSFYRAVARRCPLREILNYLRNICCTPRDIFLLMSALSPKSPPDSVSVSNANIPQNFALFNDPVDVFMILLPHVWPDEEQFMALGSVCICLAYARALVGLILLQKPDREIDTFLGSIHCAQTRVNNISSPIKDDILAVATYLNELFECILPTAFSESPSGSTENSSSSDLDTAARFEVLQLNLDPQTASSRIQEYLITRILPVVRIFALCLSRWRDALQPHEEEYPDPTSSLSLPFVGILSDPQNINLSENYFVTEFMQLISFLNAGTSGVPVYFEQKDLPTQEDVLLPFLQATAARTTLSDSLDGAEALKDILKMWLSQLVSALSPELKLITPSAPPSIPSQQVGETTIATAPHLFNVQVTSRINPFTVNQPFIPISGESGPKKSFSIADWVENLGPLMAVGGQLYPPRLIRPPNAYDELFNNLQVVSCAMERHPFQDNLLCLICGKLLCRLCMPHLGALLSRHSFHCGGWVGILLEVNTSKVYVSSGPNFCEWGSIYLDAYGEEDLELKRGKPLFLKEDRFTLLESQWMSLSFRSVLKGWHTM